MAHYFSLILPPFSLAASPHILPPPLPIPYPPSPPQPPRSLRSTSSQNFSLLILTRINPKSARARSFQYQAPLVRNSLPLKHPPLLVPVIFKISTQRTPLPRNLCMSCLVQLFLVSKVVCFCREGTVNGGWISLDVLYFSSVRVGHVWVLLCFCSTSLLHWMLIC